MVVAAINGYDGERIARLIQGFIQSEFQAKLGLVEARWALTAPLKLPVPVTYTLGFRLDLLELYSVSFPIVSVIPAERDPDGATSWGYQGHRAVIDIHFFNVADSYANVHLYTYRYAEAMTLLLQDHHFIGNHEQVDYKPSVEIGEAGRHPVAEFADMTDGGIDYVQGGRVTITLKAG